VPGSGSGWVEEEDGEHRLGHHGKKLVLVLVAANISAADAERNRRGREIVHTRIWIGPSHGPKSEENGSRKETKLKTTEIGPALHQDMKKQSLPPVERPGGLYLTYFNPCVQEPRETSLVGYGQVRWHALKLRLARACARKLDPHLRRSDRARPGPLRPADKRDLPVPHVLPTPGPACRIRVPTHLFGMPGGTTIV
jgi:hypothetical protein